VTLDFLGTLQRTHMCGDLRSANSGETVTLMGWVNRRRGTQVHECSNDIPASMFDAAVRQLSEVPSVNASVRELYTQEYYDDGTIVCRRNNLRGRLRETLTTFYDADLRLPGGEHDDKACLVAQVATVSRSYPDKSHVALVPPYLVRHRMRQTFVLTAPTSVLIHCDELIAAPSMAVTPGVPPSSATNAPTIETSREQKARTAIDPTARAMSATPDESATAVPRLAPNRKRATPRTPKKGATETTTTTTTTTTVPGAAAAAAVAATPVENACVLKREISIETVADRAWQDPCARNAVDILTVLYTFLGRLPQTARALGYVVRPLHELVPHLHSALVVRNHAQPFSRPLPTDGRGRFLPDPAAPIDGARPLADVDAIRYGRRHLVTAHLVHTMLRGIEAFRASAGGLVELEWRIGRLLCGRPLRKHSLVAAPSCEPPAVLPRGPRDAGERKKDGGQHDPEEEDGEEEEEEEEGHDRDLVYENGLSRHDFFACVRRVQNDEMERARGDKWFEEHVSDVWVDTLDYFLQDGDGDGAGGGGGGGGGTEGANEYRATVGRDMFGGRLKKKNYKMQCVTKRLLHRVDYELGSTSASATPAVAQRDAKASDGGDAGMVAGYAVRMSAMNQVPRKCPFPLVPRRNSVRLKRRMTLVSRKRTQVELSFTIVKSARGPRCSVLEAARSPDTDYEIEVEIPPTPYNRELASADPKRLVADAVALLLDVLAPIMDVAGIQPL